MAVTVTADTPLWRIAQMVEGDWSKAKGGVNYAARPYLDAMMALESVNDNYGCDRGDMIVAYFLSNATSWRGEVAREVKKELRRRVA